MSIPTGFLNMAQYKKLSNKIIWLFSWLLLFSLASGISVGAAQTSERGGADVSVTPDNRGKGEPGATVIYQHRVKNLGNVTDTFDITAVSSEGWSNNVSPENVVLLPQQQTTILVTIVVANNAQQGDIDVTTVRATSQNDPGVFDEATDTTVVPIPMYLPLMSNNAGEEAPGCQLVIHPPDNPPGVDLVVTAISLNPNSPTAGQETAVRVTVKNQGMTDVTIGNNFLIDFYDDPNPEPPGPGQIGTLYWGVQGADFEAGESVTLVSTYVFDSPGLHHLYAQVDTDGDVDEANETNNIYGCLALSVN